MTADTTTVDGVICSLEFADGSVWPAKPDAPAPRQADEPVSVKVIGLVGEGVKAKAVVYVHNFSDQPITFAQYYVDYFDAKQKKLGSTNWGQSKDEPPLLPIGEGKNLVGGNKPAPAGAVSANAVVMKVVYADGSTWKPRR